MVFSPDKHAPATAPQTPEQKAEKLVRDTRFNRTAAAVAAIRSSLREPDSAKWEEIQANEDATIVCVTYRAKNGFGGVNLDRVSYVRGKFSDEAEPWNSNCAGKALYDMKSVLRAL